MNSTKPMYNCLVKKLSANKLENFNYQVHLQMASKDVNNILVTLNRYWFVFKVKYFLK